MADIIKNILSKLPKGVITDAIYEGANIVLYTSDANFFRESEHYIKRIVDEIKKRVELRAESSILQKKEEAEQFIRKIVPEEANITNIIFDVQRGVVIIEAKKPGLVIGKQGSILHEIKKQILWFPQIQRSPAIPSKITENIRAVLYQNNNYRKKFLNSIGKKIYADWNPEKMEGWVRLTFLGSGRQVGRSCLLLQTPQSKILLDCGIDPAVQGKEQFPYFEISEFNINELDAIVLSHAHLDHSGVVPYLYKMGYRGPIYMTIPTRDVASLLCLDFIGVSYKKAKAPLYSAKDIQSMVKHSICLNYNEVTDITPDIRLTFYNAGHALGSAMVHLNIGNGLSNLLYSADIKYGKTRLLDPSVTNFARMETMILESTYGARQDILPPRQESEAELLDVIKRTIERQGKILIPELGLGRAQETMLIIEDAIKQGKLPNVPVYIDGMIWDVNAIHTAYPDFLSGTVKSMIFHDKNPFVSDIFKRVGSSHERKEVIEGGSCVVLATSGMLQGGASVEYFREFAGNKRNTIAFVCYQGLGSLGRQIQDGIKEFKMDVEGKEELVKVNMEVHTVKGLSAHSGRNQLMAFVNNSVPRPKKILVNHGEASKCLDLASSLYKIHGIETSAPRNLDTVRIK
ncbi:beta-CASP ribonuclease aCPSF1 [Candidatus Pacearchaeota archaeon]|nr:beta-CASP ribonuclease aCPSF1 [Candidatus Pacearchaeota archaeon]